MNLERNISKIQNKIKLNIYLNINLINYLNNIY